jgi:hypothetical protein
MLRRLPPLLLALIMISCGGHEDAIPETTPAVSMPQFRTAMQLPLTVDTCFILQSDCSNPLTFGELRKMKGTFADIEDSRQLQGILNDFCRIDSLRSLQKYQDYLDSIDIGMTREATAYKLGTIQLSPRSNLMLWGLNFSSYEACPLFAGNLVIGTITSSEGCTHVPLGKIFSSVDPPVFFSEQLTSEITDKWIAINSTRVSDEDMDVPGEEKQTHCYTVQIREIAGESTSPTAGNSETP